MKKDIYKLRYMLSFVLLSIFHVIEISAVNDGQTGKTDRVTILQQLLNNIGKQVTTDELKRELQFIAGIYMTESTTGIKINSIEELLKINTMKEGTTGLNSIGGLLKIKAMKKIENDARAGYVNKKLKSCIKDELKKEKLNQKVSRVAELEKELGKYVSTVPNYSRLQLLLGYSDDDLAIECKRLEKAEETLKIEIEKAKSAYAKQEDQLFYAKQKASRVAELEKELGKYVSAVPNYSRLQLFAGYSADDVAIECKRLEKAEETLEIEIEKAKSAYTEQEARKENLLVSVQAIADTISQIKNTIRKHLNDETWDKGAFSEKIIYDNNIILGKKYTEKDILDEQKRMETIKDKLMTYLQTLLDEEDNMRKREKLIDSVYAATGGRLKKYSGAYNGSNASYFYFELPDGERVMHGEFHFTGDSHPPVQIHGRFYKGKRTGTWTFKKGVLSLSVTYQKNKLQSVISKYKENPTPLISLTFKDGEINGYIKEFGEFENIAFGNVKQTTKFPDNKDVIRCAVDANGYPDGAWTKEITENGNKYKYHEFYEHGMLKKITYTDLSVTGKNTEIPLKHAGNGYKLISETVRKTLWKILSDFEDSRWKIPNVVKYEMGKVQEEKETPHRK